MFSRLTSLFRSRPPADAGEAPVSAKETAPGRVEEPEQLNDLWQLLGPGEALAPAPPMAPPIALGQAVLSHASRNRPAPSSFPSLAVKVMDLLAQPEVDIHELIRTISPDPAISAHLMRVANSALYHRGQDVLDLRTAVMRIGIRGVGEIAAGVAGRSLFDVAVRVEYETFPDRWQALFRRTMTMAFAASQCSFEQHVGRPDRVFLGGMFVDIGKTLALRSLARLIIAGQAPPDLAPAAVDALLEEVHGPIGIEALETWQLPAHLIELARLQHAPDGGLEEDSHLLRLVDGVLALMERPGEPVQAGQARSSLQALHLDRVRLRMVLKAVLEQQERVPLMFPG
nr:HDOD domain-containing protein [uncultured Holophaga sp.]